MSGKLPIEVTVNGEVHRREVEPRMTLADFLRDELGLTGTHLGCEHGVCGACSVLLDGIPVRSCIVYAVQADGAAVTTVEGLAGEDGLNPVQQAFKDRSGFQCGFCTPGFLIVAEELRRLPEVPSREQLRDAIGGNVCRCTSYQEIVDALEQALAQERAS